ncbi:MAG: hypothetical protein H6836_07650 [Planctomycetes bacterium]|nr:hypothetical protein [Planctomycetota bacterium]
MQKEHTTRRRWRRVWLTSVAVLLVLGVVEGLARLSGLAPPVANRTGWVLDDPRFPYRPPASTVAIERSIADDYEIPHNYNAVGFRDEEHPREKPAEVFRILGLGDRFTEGSGAAYADTYLRRLELFLNARPGEHPRVEVLKCGLPGYFAESERLLLQNLGLAYAPDLVVVGFVVDDVLLSELGLEAVRVSRLGYLTPRHGAALGKWGLWWYRQSHLARIVLRLYLDTWVKPLSDEQRAELNFPGEAHRGGWRELFAQYEAMLASIRKQGARMVVLHIPARAPSAEDAYPARQMAEWCTGRGVVFADALPALLEAQRSRRVYWSAGRCCTAEGYAVIARVLEEALTARALVR